MFFQQNKPHHVNYLPVHWQLFNECKYCFANYKITEENWFCLVVL